MTKSNFDYYSGHDTLSFSEHKQLITYTFNNIENTILGIMEEKKSYIYLYEYRGKYVGLEFFISFSKESVSYKLIKVTETDKEVVF